MAKQTSLFPLFLASISLIFFSCESATFELRNQTNTTETSKLFVDFSLANNEILFKDSVRFSTNTPTVKVAQWKSSQPAKSHYEPAFKTNKQGFTGTSSLQIDLEPIETTTPSEVKLYMHYRLNTSKEPQEKVFTVNFQQTPTEPKNIQQPINTPISQPNSLYSSSMNYLTATIDSLSKSVGNLKTMVSGFVSHTESTTIRLFFVFILGLLMSLTPCIYPMIPVTVGILQTTASNSLARNFMLALSYTIGIAMTFATLGLLAASGSAHFGALMGNPYFITFLVLFLGYLAFSMLGFYDMYTPRFMQADTGGTADGSFISAFIFGAISGSVASPCLSPGLLLLLSIVATLGSKFLGFLYLFIFGLGLGVPLLIIGTFSNSVNVMPRAGLWMVEVKKLFGFMLISMCFYYLNAILPWYILLWGIGFTLLLSGLLYLTTIERYHSTSMRWFKTITGTALISISILVFLQAYKATVSTEQQEIITGWQSNYEQARTQAQEEHKLLLVDFGASWCSLCNEIEHALLHHPLVNEKLDHTIRVKVDCTNPHAESCAGVQETYAIIGFPTVLLVDPNTEKVLARWGGELANTSPEEFVGMIQAYSA